MEECSITPHPPRLTPARPGPSKADIPATQTPTRCGRHTNLPFPGDGLVKEQVAGLRLIDAVVRLRLRRGAADGLEAVGRQRRRRRGRVGLVAGGAPAPVAAAAAAGRHASSLLPGSAEALCPCTQTERHCKSGLHPGVGRGRPGP